MALDRRRIMRWRRHWKAVAGLVTAVAVTLGVFGRVRVTAVTSSERRSGRAYVTADVRGKVALFDDSVVHEVSVEYDQRDYDRMIETFRQDGDKGYIDARVTIDGTTLERVALRLKGNSTLMALGGRGPGGRALPRGAGFPGGGGPGFGEVGAPGATGATGADGAGGGAPAAGNGLGGLLPAFDAPAGADAAPPAPAAGADAAGGFGGFPGGGPFGGFGGSGVSADKPEALPWLLSFNEIDEGLRYQGFEEVSIRPSGLGTAPTTMLHEPLSLDVIAAAGEPAQRASYAAFSVNGAKPVLRLLVESPGENFVAEHFGGDGVLYKSLSTGRFQYRGEDPLAYETSFKQITRRKQQDLQPLIDLIKFVEQSSDTEFAQGLPRRVDTTSLARYLALHNLLLDFDDMGGPGQNSYWWYDFETRKFSVVTWDVNLTFSGSPTQGPLESGGFPGGGRLPGGGRFPGGAPGGGFGPLGGHKLKERFLATPVFKDIYLQQYRLLYDHLFTKGAALTILDSLRDALATRPDLLQAETLRAETASVASAVERRRVGLISKVGVG